MLRAHASAPNPAEGLIVSDKQFGKAEFATNQGPD